MSPFQLRPFQHLQRVYCAGPLFNIRERDEMVLIADALVEAGFEVFVPHRDGMEFAQVLPYLVEKEKMDPADIAQLLHEAVFALDVYQVMVECGSLVCNLNGRVPDEGAVSETAMAWTLGKPIVLYKDDVRTKIENRDNPLVVGLTDFQVIPEIQNIAQALQDQIAKLAPHPEMEYPCPPHLQEPLTRGEKLWKHLKRMGHQRPVAEVAEVILDLFANPSLPL